MPSADLRSRDLVVAVQQPAPGAVAQFRGTAGRIDDVGEQDRGEHPIRVLRGTERVDLFLAPGVLLDVPAGGLLRFRLVDEQDHAAGEGARVHQAQVVGVDLIAEEMLPAAEDDREQHQPILVDEVVLHQVCDELCASIAGDVPAGLALQVRDLLDQVSADEAGIGP